MKIFHDMSACPTPQLPKDISDPKNIVKVLLHAEQYAVREYTEICNMAVGKDHRTYDLVLAILHEEIEHEAWPTKFLDHDASDPSEDHQEQTANLSQVSPISSSFLSVHQYN